MQRHVSTFIIVPPADLNDEVVRHAVYMQHDLAVAFPGYDFEVADLRRFKPVSFREPITFGDGMSFVVLPLLGATSDNDGQGGYMAEQPDESLIADIAEFCGKFDFQKSRRHAA